MSRWICIIKICAIIGVILLFAGCRPAPTVTITDGPAPRYDVMRGELEGETVAFVLNPSTQRFHRPGCSWAARIDPERRIDWAGDRETLIAVGYQPCSYCDP